MSKHTLSIIIPSYNEEKNLEQLVKEFSTAGKNNDFELILVNNGSTDNSEAKFSELQKKFELLKIVQVKKNQGYGFGIAAGLREANGTYVSWTHADLQISPKYVFEALKRAVQEPNKNIFVKGKRSGRSITDMFFTFGMTIFCSIVLGEWLNEINAQPNLFHKSFLKKIKNPPKDFSFDLYVFYLAKKSNLKIIR